jgi:hypothetical protein
MVVPSMAEVPKYNASFTQAYLRDCYTDFDRLVEANIKHFDSVKETHEVITYLCGKVLSQSKDSGVGLIILNLNESKDY